MSMGGRMITELLNDSCGNDFGCKIGLSIKILLIISAPFLILKVIGKHLSNIQKRKDDVRIQRKLQEKRLKAERLKNKK